MTKADSYPGITAAQLANQMRDAGAYILDDFLHAAADGKVPPVFEGKPLGSLVMNFQFALLLGDANNLHKWTAERPDWPKDTKGQPYPSLPRQKLEIGISRYPALDGMTEISPYDHTDAGEVLLRDIYPEIPKESIEVRFFGRNALDPTWRVASNKPSLSVSDKPVYSTKYYLGAGAELARACAKLSPDYEKISEEYSVHKGPKSVEGKPITIHRATLLVIEPTTPLNGTEDALDEYVQRGWYGAEAHTAGTFYDAYYAKCLSLLDMRSRHLDTFQKFGAPDDMLENVRRQVEVVTTAIESVKRFL